MSKALIRNLKFFKLFTKGFALIIFYAFQRATSTGDDEYYNFIEKESFA